MGRGHAWLAIAIVCSGCATTERAPGAPPAKPPADKHSSVAPCQLPRLLIEMTFLVDCDFDLHVVTPSGTEIYYGNTEEDGGELEDDLCISSCGGGIHREAVYFCSILHPGKYQVWAENYDGRARGGFNLLVGGAVSTSHMGFLDDYPGDMADPIELDITP